MKTLSLRWLVASAFALVVAGCGNVTPTDQTSLAPTHKTAISFASLEEDEDPCEMDICNPGCYMADPCMCEGICDGGGGDDPGDPCAGNPCSPYCFAQDPCRCYPDMEECGGAPPDGPPDVGTCSGDQCGRSVGFVLVCPYPTTAVMDCSTCTGECS